MYVHNPLHILLVISLEESEYSVAEENGPLALTITMNDEPSQDFMVEVSVTDKTARGMELRTYVHK